MGNLNAKVAPFPSLFLAQILPPCSSIMFLDIYRPKPVPRSDLVANFVNSLGMISLSIQVPVSLTETAA
jgi:hypothetical protein